MSEVLTVGQFDNAPEPQPISGVVQVYGEDGSGLAVQLETEDFREEHRGIYEKDRLVVEDESADISESSVNIDRVEAVKKVGQRAILAVKQNHGPRKGVRKKKGKGSNGVWWTLPCADTGEIRFICWNRRGCTH